MMKSRKAEPRNVGVKTTAPAAAGRRRATPVGPPKVDPVSSADPRRPTIGVRELRDSLSEQLRGVRVGRTLTVTDHGEPIAMLVPYGLPAGAIRMLSEGRATWNGSKMHITPPKYRNTGQPLSALVIQMREEHERELDRAIRATAVDLHP